MCLRKVCPQCNTMMHMRRSVCECSHVFQSKRKTSDNEPGKAKKRKRALESEQETLQRKEKDRVQKACRRACETREQIMYRKENAQGKHESLRNMGTNFAHLYC